MYVGCVTEHHLTIHSDYCNIHPTENVGKVTKIIQCITWGEKHSLYCCVNYLSEDGFLLSNDNYKHCYLIEQKSLRFHSLSHIELFKQL